MITGNNVGEYAGTASVSTVGELVVYYPSPHLISDQQTTAAGTQSPGYVTESLSPLTPLGWGASFWGAVAGINDHSVMAYSMYQPIWTSGTTSTGTWTTYISVPGDGQNLGTLGGASALAAALNNSNQVVGWSQIANGAQHAFLYSNGSMQDLNLLDPATSGITLGDAVGIDSAGEIVAYGTNASGQMHEYLLTPAEVPVPEPSMLAVMSLIIVPWRRHAQERFKRKRSRRN